LSVQVHPPAEIAARLGGEPKTEMWYLLDTLLDADLYAGLNAGVTRTDFEQALAKGEVANLVHRLPARAGDALFIPSGRIHAIGAGNLVFEVQQNSDTTYRVFDWNRLGLDGFPRELHLSESLESINFHDSEPQITRPVGELIVECDDFRVEKWALTVPRISQEEGFAVFVVLSGSVECAGRRFKPGDLFLTPVLLEDRELKPLEAETSLLRTTIPSAEIHPTISPMSMDA
ncbi:MAG: class I mannose-6-phosphate isomerase, partial [Verrucomicrobiota bacterium]